MKINRYQETQFGQGFVWDEGWFRVEFLVARVSTAYPTPTFPTQLIAIGTGFQRSEKKLGFQPEIFTVGGHSVSSRRALFLHGCSLLH